MNMHDKADLKDALIRQAAALIRDADALIIGAGAGMGVDSGLPDFRGNEGFWRAYPALKHARLRFEDAASPRTFEADPCLAWGFYGHRLKLYRDIVPHDGFALLRGWAASKPGGCWVFTSNVDGQFQKAGFDPVCIEECHGSIHRLQCLDDCKEVVWPADSVDPHVDEHRCLWQGELPRCPHCGRLARPNILMFEDYRWNDAPRERQRSARMAWLNELKAKRLKPVVLELGAGVAIPAVRHFAVLMRQEFKEAGARLVRINPQHAAVSGSLDVGLPMGALAALQAIQSNF